MAATEGNSQVQLRIGGWLPAPDADRGDPDGSAITELIPRVRYGGRMTEPQPARPPAASTHAIRLGVVAPAITDADESRHRRHRRRPVALVAAATVALAGGVPLVLGLVSGPTRPDDAIPPGPSVAPSGPVPQPPVFDLPDRSATPAPTRTGPRTTTPAATHGPPRGADGTARVDRPHVAGPAGPASTSSSPSGALSLEAEGDPATRSGQAAPRAVAAASGGIVIGWVGNGSGNTLRFTGLDVPAAGPYDLVVAYCSGEVRSANIAVNGSPVARVDFASTGSFDTVATTTVRLPLAAGPNTVEFSNPDAWAPDFDRVTLTR